MAYTDPSFKTKKELVEAVKSGKEVRIVSAGFFPPTQNGRDAVEGPAYRPHSWYASVEVENGIIKKIK